MAQHGHLSREEKKRIRKERKKLRKDLKKDGIKSRREFEEIAQMLGLVYGDDGPFLLPWLWKLGDFLAAMSVWKYLTTLIAITGLLFAYSVIANQKGNFTVNVSRDLLNLNYELSDSENFEKPKVRCVSQVLKEVNPYSIQDIPDNMDDQNGSHNMNNVVAYTFWIRNNGTQASKIDWYMILNKSTKNVHKAVWGIIFDEGTPTIYARAKENGESEVLEGLTMNGFIENAPKKGNNQFYKMPGGMYGVKAMPYEEEQIVASKKSINMAPGEKHRYTVVLWIEGDDPDCSDELIGGHAGYTFKFVQQGDEDILSGEDYMYKVDNASDGSLIGKIRKIFNRE